jgi:hypothetical protein
MIEYVEVASGAPGGADIVLLHGIDGDPIASWSAGESRPIFAQRLAARFPDARIVSLGYPASLARFRATPELDLTVVAAKLADDFEMMLVPARPTVFVGFCLGGLLTAIALRLRQRVAPLPPTLLFLLDAPLREAEGEDPFPQVRDALGLTGERMTANLDWLRAAMADDTIAVVSILTEAPGWMAPYGRDALSPPAPLYRVPGDHLAMVAATDTGTLATLDHVVTETDAFIDGMRSALSRCGIFPTI